MSLQNMCMSTIVQNISGNKIMKSAQITNFIHKTPGHLHPKLIEEIITLIEKEISTYTTSIMEIIVPYITDDIIASYDYQWEEIDRIITKCFQILLIQ